MRFVKLFLFFALACSSVGVHAVGFQFSDISLPVFAETVLKGVLRRDYILSPALLEKGDILLRVNVANVKEDEALRILRNVLFSQGIATHDLAGGVLFLDAVSSAVDVAVSSPSAPVLPDVVEVYRPRFRSVAFLHKALTFTGVQVQGEGDTLVIAGTSEQLKRAKTLLGSVDASVSSVDVRAVLLEVTESSEISRSFSSVFSLLSGKLGVQLQAGTQLQNFFRFKSTSITAILSALNGDSRFRYIAEPSLGVLDGHEARLVVGSDEPVRGALRLDNNGNSVQSIDYKTAGVVFSVTPHVYKDFISLHVNQELSSFKATSNSNIDSPTILKRQSSTVIDAREGEVIVLAGLDETREQDTSEGFSWLPWRLSRAASSNRSQILLMLEVHRRGDGA
jgi:type II secretory pathway component GspD/PulD (secretin)